MGRLGTIHRHVVRVVSLTTGQPVTGLATPDFVFTLRRRDSGGNLVDITATDVPTASEIGSGEYWIEWTPTVGAGFHLLEVTPAAAGQSIAPTSFEVDVESGAGDSTGPYLSTLARVKTALGIGHADDDALLTQLLGDVTADIQSYCHRRFFRESVTEYPDGPGSSQLLLDHYPVISVTSVHATSARPPVWDATTLLVEAEDYVLTSGGILYRFGTWPVGPNTIRVELDGGYDVIPADLSRATDEIVAVKLDKGKGRRYHVTSEARGDGSISGIRFDDLTPDVVRTLNRYRDTSRPRAA